MCDSHEVGVPLWSKILVVSEVDRFYVSMEALHVGMVVHDCYDMLINVTLVKNILKFVIYFDEVCKILNCVLFLGSLKSNERRSFNLNKNKSIGFN